MVAYLQVYSCVLRSVIRSHQSSTPTSLFAHAQYLPAQVRPITDRNTHPAAAATARKKKERNSALLMNDWRYFKAAYACIKANTPGKETGKNQVRTQVKLYRT